MNNRRNTGDVLVQKKGIPRNGSKTAGDAFPAIITSQKREAGFTIVEVLVAVMVFALGLTAIAGMQTRSIEQSSFSGQMSLRISAITHQAELLKSVPVQDDQVTITGGKPIDVETASMFEEENMCGYGKTCQRAVSDYCDYGAGWNELYNTDKSPLKLCQRITQDYPLPGLIMIELEAKPTGVTKKEAERRKIDVSYIRSTRFN